MNEICIVRLVYGSYNENVTVYCDPDDDNDEIKRKAWSQVKADFLSMAYKSATIISRQPYNGD